ncbi:epoxide hydrolase family protein [Micromonospora sp. NPDC007208]|uniref:epoxide hydrolase family protein n=1 Tax=Micromonospora sp. NPDC007208 TaxID=3364236 RepID=UPI0036772504
MERFRVDILQEDVDDLRRRLRETRWPVLFDAGWDRGVPADYLRELVDYWCDEFDWRAMERRINEVPQFVTTINGAPVHFLHVRSPEPDATPMIITHGWPGSVTEFLDVIGPLTDPVAHGGDAADAFHLVIPSMPGFGFSGPMPAPGWNNLTVAKAWAELMSRLGYDRYIAQGGDFGAGISYALAQIDAEHVVGLHLNTLVTTPAADGSDVLDDEDRRRLARSQRFLDVLAGSMKLQATRPHTIAYALSDSPVGQLAWIVEKFKDWADSGKVPEDAVERDRILAIVSIFWFTGTAGSSAQFYYETVDYLPISNPTVRYAPIRQPLGVAVFPQGVFLPIRRFVERDFPTLSHWSEFDRGGHFAALEEPDLFVGDVRKFARVVRAGS